MPPARRAVLKILRFCASDDLALALGLTLLLVASAEPLARWWLA